MAYGKFSFETLFCKRYKGLKNMKTCNILCNW